MLRGEGVPAGDSVSLGGAVVSNDSVPPADEVFSDDLAACVNVDSDTVSRMNVVPANEALSLRGVIFPGDFVL